MKASDERQQNAHQFVTKPTYKRYTFGVSKQEEVQEKAELPAEKTYLNSTSVFESRIPASQKLLSLIDLGLAEVVGKNSLFEAFIGEYPICGN